MCLSQCTHRHVHIDVLPGVVALVAYDLMSLAFRLLFICLSEAYSMPVFTSRKSVCTAAHHPDKASILASSIHKLDKKTWLESRWELQSRTIMINVMPWKRIQDSRFEISWISFTCCTRCHKWTVDTLLCCHFIVHMQGIYLCQCVLICFLAFLLHYLHICKETELVSEVWIMKTGDKIAHFHMGLITWTYVFQAYCYSHIASCHLE